ncbi:hypothetical protein BTO32_15080 [Marinobacter lutaoensis]|uniref:Uncharacterized protein n=1 Tax=Marinobacter lutaoensis TaxID=135739 RepID=A0A1V2DPH8_9GAMM|nr:hypothetical protein [Marinobacter lutaoensis]ONF42532.1 hypothetical protein BTO32_15080 [Marinobacter lutaoensis]
MNSERSTDHSIINISLGMEVFYRGERLDSRALAQYVSVNAYQWLAGQESHPLSDVQIEAYCVQSIADPEDYREKLEEKIRNELEKCSRDIPDLAREIVDAGLTSTPAFIRKHLNSGSSDRVYQINNQGGAMPPPMR